MQHSVKNEHSPHVGPGSAYSSSSKLRYSFKYLKSLDFTALQQLSFDEDGEQQQLPRLCTHPNEDVGKISQSQFFVVEVGTEQQHILISQFLTAIPKKLNIDEWCMVRMNEMQLIDISNQQ